MELSQLSRDIQQRYVDYVDQYKLEQLCMRYLISDTKGRIRLLKRLQQTYWGVPNDIARLAAEDTDRRVRAWYARQKGLHSTEAWRKLSADPDPLVRACLMEGNLNDNWESATELERLAYLQRRFVEEEFVLKLFDPENGELGLSQEDRTRYTLTFLAARAAPGKMDLTDLTGCNLIELMPKWPKNAGIQDFVYRFCNPRGHIDVVYEHCDEPRWRRLLLENVLSLGMSVVSVEGIRALARKDPDDKCRELAHMDPWIRTEKQAVFRQALKSRDLAALRGLAQNKGLKPRQLIKVLQALSAFRGDRSDEIDIESYCAAVRSARETLQAVQEPRPEQGEKHERTTRKQLARQDSRIMQAKLDTVANWVKVGLRFTILMAWWGWIGSTVGLLAGTVVYLLTGSLPLAVFALALGLWGGVSWALLWLLHFYRTPEGRFHFISLRGMQPYYPEEDRPTHRRWPTREEDQEALQTARVFKRARKGRVEYPRDLRDKVGDYLQQQDGEVDVETERQRIERYKAALVEAERPGIEQAKAASLALAEQWKGESDG